MLQLFIKKNSNKVFEYVINALVMDLKSSTKSA